MAITIRSKARAKSIIALIARPVVMALLLAGATTIPMQAAAAGPPIQASGAVQPTAFTLTSIRFSDGNLIIDGHEILVISGSFSGAIDQADEIIVHPDGTAVDHFAGTLTGSVVGCGAGTVALQGEALIVGDALDGQLSFVDQSRNTLDVHADLKVAGQAPNLVYAGIYSCG